MLVRAFTPASRVTANIVFLVKPGTLVKQAQAQTQEKKLFFLTFLVMCCFTNFPVVNILAFGLRLRWDSAHV